MKNSPFKQDGRKPGTNGMRSVRIVAGLIFLFLVSGFLIPPFGFPAGKGKMIEKIDWPPEAAGWKWDGEEQSFERESLYEYINGSAEVYLAYNYRKATARRYTRPGHPDIVVDVYRMGSAEDAYGVFSLEQQDPEAGIGQGSEFGGSLLRFWKGPYFVTLLGNGTGKELAEAVLGLGRELAKRIQEIGQPPRLLRFLPEAETLPPPDRVCFVRSHVLLNRCFFISHQNILRLGQRCPGPSGPLSPGEKQASHPVDTLSHGRPGPVGFCRLPVRLSAGGRSPRRRADRRRCLDQGGTF